MNPTASPWLKKAERVIIQAERELQQALRELEPSQPLKIRDRNGDLSPYSLPLSYGCLGLKAESLSDLSQLLEGAHHLLQDKPDELMPLERAGLASIIAHEVSLAIGSIRGQEPASQDTFKYNGPVAETKLRDLGIRLLDGRLAGLALLAGKARDDQVASRIIQQFSSKGLLLLVSGDKLVKAGGVEWGYDSGVIPLGPDPRSLAYAFGFITAFALQFGKLSPGNLQRLLQYIRSNLHGFLLLLGKLTEADQLMVPAALVFGFPAASDLVSPPPELTSLENFVSLPFDQLPGEDELEKADTLADHCIDHSGIKVRLPKKPTIPVGYGTELEGEAVSDNELQAEFKGFELVTLRGMSEIRDGRVRIIGPEVGEARAEFPLGLLVEVAGRRMKREFEPVLERQLLHLIASAEGLEHQGNRDKTRIRFSKRAVQKGLRLEHLGHILHIGLHSEFDSVVDKVQVTIYTEPNKVQELLEEARRIYWERDARVAGLRDEAVDTFYSCLSCQSLTPYHLCIITPERPGMCGAVNYLDCQASYEINPGGQNHPIAKDGCLDPVKGEWENINKYVYEHSQTKFSRFCLNSILDDPPTISSLCECLTILIPEANGVMVVDREDPSLTPLGMTFPELLSMSVGAQTPGFLGHARVYLTSEKFLAAEGGIKRVVWMSQRLKEELEENLREACERAGEPDLLDKIGDGETTPTIEDLLTLLREKKHPALDMPPIM